MSLCLCIGTGVLAVGLYVYGALSTSACREVPDLEGHPLHSRVPVLL